MTMTGYDAAAWSDFGVAVAGAAAALSGLLFVAVSINIQRILSFASLPERAAQTLIMLVVPLLVALLLIIPGQPRGVLAGELIATGMVGGAGLWRLGGPSTRAAQEGRGRWLATRALPSAAIAIMLVLAGVTLVADAGGGLYWVAPVVLVAFISGLSNAWVLLVEILR
jgi:modulator of FtsH protease